MALQRVGWENGSLVEPAKVLADNTIQPAQYEGTTPLSAANLKKMEDNTEDFVNELIGTLENLDTIAKDNLVSAINEVFNKTNVVYEEILEVDASSIVANNLDIVADGGEYEFELLAMVDKSSEVEIKIDNFVNSYFNMINHVADSTDGSHSITPIGSYQPNEDAIKGWLYLAESATSGYFSVTKGNIWCIDGKTNYHIEHSLALRSRHSLSDIRGLIGVNNDNINSLTFSARGEAKFKAGTRLTIRKVR